MSDYKYDNQDVTAMRTAITDLRNNDKMAILGCLFSIASLSGYHYLIRERPNSLWKNNPLKLGGTLVAATLVAYNVMTWNSRSRLDRAAEHINIKYTSIIARTLNYEN